MSSLLTDTAEDPVEWGRLDARTILVRPFAQIGQLLAPLLGVILLGRSISGLWTGILAAVVVLGAGTFAYLTTRYRVTSEQVQVRSGLVTRSRLAAPRDRVRTVEATAPPVHRLLGVVRVRIGTGTGAAGGKSNELVLDAVSQRELDALRSALLRRDTPTGSPPDPPDFTATGDPSPGGPSPGSSDPVPAVGADGELLLRWDARWLGYAPLSTAGLAALAGLIGIAFQFGDDLGVDSRLGSVEAGLSELPVALLVGVGVVVVLGISVVASVVINLLGWFGLALRRDRDGSLHVRRGLLTTRTVTVEDARLRGVELIEPLAVRAAGGARLAAVVSGLATGDGDTSSADLCPPAPRGAVLGVAGRIAGPGLAGLELVGHPRAALRRRMTRTLVPLAVLLIAGVVGVAVGLVAWWVPAGVAVLGVPLAVALARSRYRGLGHAVGPELMAVRQGSLLRRTTVLRRDGIIGVTVRSNVFQRRGGLATVAMTTAAGPGEYEMLDVGAAQGLAAADAAVPGLLAPFLVRAP